MNLYWGDLHTHFTDLENGDALLRDARENIDFCAVLCYPFTWDERAGLRVESVRQRPEFLRWWERLQELSAAHHDPGRFVTFPGYEWHGNRTRWGDHNVLYLRENEPLDDSWELDTLFRNLHGRRALALPHHTGYLPGRRGKDWSLHDEALSPVMEVFSIHGSSEGEDTPRPMESNSSMGPRASGGTYQDALARGCRVGAIASNDYTGLQGRWGIGRAAVRAEACTRESLWEAIRARRTYGVTGDRIELEFHAAGAAMGSETRAGAAVDALVSVTGSHAIDRIELVHNGVVADTWCHAGRWERRAREARRFKVFVEAGWGPAAHYGLEAPDRTWDCRLEVRDGRLAGVERCFSLREQRILGRDERRCAWRLVTAGRRERNPFGMCQGVVFEMEGGPETILVLDMDGERLELCLADLLERSALVPLLEEARRAVRDAGLRDELENPDIYYHNARKVKVHRAIPESGYRAAHTFRGVPLQPGPNYLYARVSQLNGQMAWSSPVWVESA